MSQGLRKGFVLVTLPLVGALVSMLASKIAHEFWGER